MTPPSAPWLGAVALGDGTVRFRLWAPAARRVELLLDGRAHTMAPEDDGCHCLTLRAAAGARYRYRIDGGEPLPDPASRWQPDGLHGDSAVVDPTAHAWQDPAWRGRPWHEAVVYELHVGSCGGYRGVAEQLPRLAQWGITAIELMPLAQFPGRRNWGYDGALPFAPAAAYGHPDELRALVDRAHALGLMVLLDVVYNHFGPDGNHLGGYAPMFFRDDLPTPWGAAIDFRVPQVQRFFIDNALMWLREYRFDGLRLDAVHAIRPPAFLGQLREAVYQALPPDRQVHLVLENEDNRASLLGPGGYTAQWNDDFHNALHVLLTGETDGYYAAYAREPERLLARVLGEGFAYQGQAMHDGRLRGEPSAQLPPTAFVAFLQNHDQVGNRAFGERLRELVDEPRLRAATALLALCPMIPLFFQGEPWGSRAPFLFFTDFEPPLDAQVREGRRREFARFPAFADAHARGAIPDPNAPETFARSQVRIDEAGAGEGARWAAWFAALLALRHRHLVPLLPQARALGAGVPGPGAVEARWSLGALELQLAANFGDAPVPLAAFPGARVLHAENGAGDGERLPPAGFVARLRDAP